MEKLENLGAVYTRVYTCQLETEIITNIYRTYREIMYCNRLT